MHLYSMGHLGCKPEIKTVKIDPGVWSDLTRLSEELKSEHGPSIHLYQVHSDALRLGIEALKEELSKSRTEAA